MARTGLAAALAAVVVVLAGAAGADEAQSEAQSEAKAAVVTAAVAVQPAAAPAAPETRRGPETGLPLPRYVSLKTSEGRARRGPNRTHRIDWVFARRDMPLRVTAEFEHWRRVEDHEGQGGWMHHALLSGVRTVLVTEDLAAMRAMPQPGAPEVAYLQAGVVARVLRCEPDWCRLGVDGHRGWVGREALWGVEPHEFLD
jgi:SH3-like domain-containing protein